MLNAKPHNFELLDCLQLKIVLKGHDWDGNLNITQIEVEGKEKKFLLDTFTLNGENTYLNGEPVYELTTGFETLEETIACFGDDDAYDFEQSLADLILEGAVAKTNLDFETRKQEQKEAIQNNINRVILMQIGFDDDTYTLPVKHDPELLV